MNKILKLAALLGLTAAYSFAQLVTTQTTFSVAVPPTSAATSGGNVVSIASCTTTVLPGPTVVGSYLWADWEAMQVKAIISGTIGGSGACTLNVSRGVLGTKIGPHAVTAIVYVGNQANGSGDSSRPFSGGFLALADPQGSCVSTAQYTLPIVATISGRVWSCPTSGPLANLWAVLYDPTAIFQTTDGYIFLPPTNCGPSQSGGTLVSAGYTTIGTSVVSVAQVSTTTTTSTQTYVCTLTLPDRLRNTAGAAINNVVVVYGVQTSALGTQAAVLASGTFNGSTVFSKITFPVPGASETASTVAPVRADSGTLTITPVAASFNTAVTTAGAFYTATFTPATPINTNVDNTEFLFTFSVLGASAASQVTNVAGLYVHITGAPL